MLQGGACGKELQNRYSLKGVVQSHQFDTCKVCNETMKTITLYQHMEIHQEKRSQYECEQCDKSYATKFM